MKFSHTYVDTAMIQDAIENIIQDQQAYIFGPKWMTNQVGHYLSKKIKDLVAPSEAEVLKVLNLMWQDDILIRQGDNFLIDQRWLKDVVSIDETKVKSKQPTFKMTLNLTIESNQ
jgi:NAD(P)H-flavin reductase